MHVTILMSTYNGEHYIRQQLDSIFSQLGVEIRLIVRDDGSKDKTLEILNEYKNKNNNIIIYCGQNVKPCKSFLNLINNYCDDDFFALADQDDIWDEDKILTAISYLRVYDSKTPALYYSNLKLVDKNNKFFRNAHSKPLETENKYSALAENRATGCTIVYNRALAEIVCSKKVENFTMHDTYLFVVCSLFGKICYDFIPHIRYRQHDNNCVGIKLNEKKIKKVLCQIIRFFDMKQQPRYYDAQIILDKYRKELSGEDLRKVNEIVEYKQNLWSRLRLFCDGDIKSLNMLHNLRLRILILHGNF